MSNYTVARYSHRAIDPAQWDEWILHSPEGGVFHLHGYASIVAPEWEALIVSRNGHWEAVLPFVLSSRFGIGRSLQPRFTQYWGVCFAPRDGSHYDTYSRKKEIQEQLLLALPPVQQVIWQFSPYFDYPLPWHWSGFSLQLRYTYQVQLTQEKLILAEAAPSLRRKLRQGRDLVVANEERPAVMIDLLQKQAQAGHRIIGQQNGDWERVRTLIQYLIDQGYGRMRVVQSAGGEVLGAAIFVRYRRQGMYLIGTYDPSNRAQKAMPVLIWEAMKEDLAAGMTIFDFEGSMIPGVERFFRRWGAKPIPYLQVRKNTLPLLIRWISESR